MSDETGRSWPARHFDGETPEPWSAHVGIEPGALLVRRDEEPTRRWPLEAVVIVNDDPRRPVHLELHGERIEALHVSGDGFLPALRAASRTRPLRRIDGAKGGLRAILVLALASIAFLFAAWRWGLPALASLVAAEVPASWERTLGNVLIAELVPEDRMETDAQVTRPVEDAFARVRAASAGLPDSSRVLVLRSATENAFAVPGGYVVITTGMLRILRDADELAAVMAHEVTHLTARHTTRGVIERAGLRFLLALLAGDDSALKTIAGGASTIGELSYSRDDELEADAGAIELLGRAGIDPAALARSLETLSSAEKSTGGAPPEFLSTHPATGGRRDRARTHAAKVVVTGRPAVADTAAWRAMRTALAARPDPPETPR